MEDVSKLSVCLGSSESRRECSSADRRWDNTKGRAEYWNRTGRDWTCGFRVAAEAVEVAKESKEAFEAIEHRLCNRIDSDEDCIRD